MNIFKLAQVLLLNCKDIYFERVRRLKMKMLPRPFFWIFLIYLQMDFIFLIFTGIKLKFLSS